MMMMAMVTMNTSIVIKMVMAMVFTYDARCIFARCMLYDVRLSCDDEDVFGC